MIVIMDCCHSGTMTDLACCTAALKPADILQATGAEVVSGRYVKLDPLPAGQSKGKTPQPKPRAIKPPEKADDKKMMWAFSGCQDNQTSGDAFIDGKRQGALTWALMKSLAEANYNISFEDLLASTRLKLKLGGFPQVPALSTTNEPNFKATYMGGSPAGVVAAATKKTKAKVAGIVMLSMVAAYCLAPVVNKIAETFGPHGSMIVGAITLPLLAFLCSSGGRPGPGRAASVVPNKNAGEP